MADVDMDPGPSAGLGRSGPLGVAGAAAAPPRPMPRAHWQLGNRDQSLLHRIQPLSGACWTSSLLFVLAGF